MENKVKVNITVKVILNIKYVSLNNHHYSDIEAYVDKDDIINDAKKVVEDYYKDFTDRTATVLDVQIIK